MQNRTSWFQRWLEISLADLSLRLATALIILFAGLVLAAFASSAIRAALRRSPLRARALLVNFLSRTARIVIGVIAAVVALAELGLNIAPLIAGIGVTGFIVGFAFKDSLSNLAAGLLLLFYQPFDVGDFVEAGGQAGTVLDMSIAATELKMPDGRLAIVPNSRVWNAPIINFNRLGKRRIEWTVGVAYRTDLGVALQTLREVIAGDERVLAEPGPQVLVNGLGESSVDLVVRAWVLPRDFGAVMSDVRQRTKEALDERGIEIPFPHRVLVQRDAGPAS